MVFINSLYLFYGIQTRTKLGLLCTRYSETIFVTMVYDVQSWDGLHQWFNTNKNSVTLETSLYMNDPCYTSFLTNSMHANHWESTKHSCEICNQFWHSIPLHIIMVSFMQPKPQSCKCKFHIGVPNDVWSKYSCLKNWENLKKNLNLRKIVICTLLRFSSP